MNLVLVYSIIEPLRYFTDQLKASAESRGIGYYTADCKDAATYTSEEFYSFLKRPDTFMLTFNGALVNQCDGNGENVWKKNGVPVISFVNDHPRNYDSFLHEPACEIHVVSLDKNHMDFIKRFYPGISGMVFCANGGTEEPGHKPYDERSIDVIYMGSCQTKLQMFPRIPGLPQEGAELFRYGIGLLARDPGETAENAVYSYLDKAGIKLDENNMYKLMVEINASAYIENYVRRYFKLSCMKALDNAGIHVDIYGGDSWLDDEIVFTENIVIHDRIPNRDLNKILGDAKISLCFMPWYKRGSSEKVMDSMLNGAVCVSDRSEYLDGNYRDGDNIVYFELNAPDKLAASVAELLADPRKAAAIAGKGYKTALEHDTWDHRFDLLLDYVGKLI